MAGPALSAKSFVQVWWLLYVLLLRLSWRLSIASVVLFTALLAYLIWSGRNYRAP